MTEELRAIERSLAYEQATQILDGDLMVVGGGEWRDLADYEKGDDPEIDDALAYLEARGLVERHPQHATWITFREESEATA